jgi:hypothetical protein
MRFGRSQKRLLTAAGAVLLLWPALLSGRTSGSAASCTETARTDDLTSGLEVWRKQGAIQNGAACATCHSPDGIELAEYGFDDADITRRALPHLGAEDAQRIVNYIHTLRAKLNITHLRDPNLDRPLQPGGAVLPGKTAAERDFAFGRELEEKLPTLFHGRIESIAQARAAEKELFDVSPVSLKIGIPLSRLSEDVAHGSEHASIDQWLPEEPPIIPPAKLQAWYAAEDAYLANPDHEHLHQLLALHNETINASTQPGLKSLSTLKFRSLLVLQDRMRHGTEGREVSVTDDLLGPGSYNALWSLGDSARLMVDRTPADMQMSPETEAKKVGAVPLSTQLHQLRVAWFWLGWLSDQGLFRTSPEGKTKYGMWLSQSLSQDGPYPFHDVYANARRQAVLAHDPAAWGEPIERKRRIWDMAGLRSFRFYVSDMPKEPEYQKLYATFTANCFRMNLQLLKDSILTTHDVWIKISAKANVHELGQFIEYAEPETKNETDKLQEELVSLIDGANERR